MEPQQTQEPQKPKLDDEYAQSLLRTVTSEFEQKQALKPAQKHFISKKALVVLVATLVLSIVAALAASHYTK